MSKLRVAIIFGGKSTEHQVSLQSAKNIINELDRTKFDLCLIGINEQGQWHEYAEDNYLINSDNPSTISLSQPLRPVAIIPGSTRQQFISLTDGQPLAQIDVVFPIVHGAYGEDGTLQGLLHMIDMPYVGPNIMSSAACMDKDITKRLLDDAGLAVAPFITLMAHQLNDISYNEVVEQLGLPLFIKPANLGSSVGISKVNNEAEFNAALSMAFEYDLKVIIESAIVGREIECAVLGNEEPEVSPCGEIVLNDAFYAYNTKYIDDDGAKVVVPADLDNTISLHIRQTALKAYQVLNCLGMSRVDVFLTEDNQVIINEINTLPGFTNISMYPKLWQSTGLDYQSLITKLIELALEHHKKTAVLKTKCEL
ncbi:TPA: D-alanine--D-alanine ligase [Proteus mirabilis]|nr:D-alanine--D-alanine ligase [Proteus mirabilis]